MGFNSGFKGLTCYVLKDIPSVVSQELVADSCRPSGVRLMDLSRHLRNDFQVYLSLVWHSNILWWKYDSVITVTGWDQEVNYQSAPELNYWNVQLCSKHISSCWEFGRCCAEAVHNNMRVSGVVIWGHWLKLTLSSYTNFAFIPLWNGNECGKNKSNENFKTTIPSKNYGRPKTTRECGIF